MTQCWSEGELRAHLDGELPSRDMERLSGHLEGCVVCASRRREFAARAERIGEWMEGLAAAEMPVRIPRVPRRARGGRRWAAVAVGLAASLVIALLLVARRTDPIAVGPHPEPAAPKTAAPPPATVKPAVIRRETPPPVRAKPKPQIQYYVALDDEPIETGLVVRVGLNDGQVPADVIVGPDGRARAIRLVSENSGEQK